MDARPYYLDASWAGADTLPDGAAVLGVLGFGAGRPDRLAETVPFAAVTMDVLDGGAVYEVWAGAAPAVRDAGDGVRFAVAGRTLFGMVDVMPDAPGMEAAAFDAYARLFALAERSGHRHVIRVFNYLPDITGDEDGMERYRRFNAGRHRAFAAARQAMDAAPAACALGMHGGAPVVAFIASTEPGQAVENPRQVSAYRYPKQHGPSSPSFSRAMRQKGCLHVSGTASIIGHESRHPGDVRAQTQESLRNVAALLEAAGSRLADVHGRLELKAYVRHAGDVGAVLDVMGDMRPKMVLQADICRQDLLVEIEGFLGGLV